VSLPTLQICYLQSLDPESPHLERFLPRSRFQLQIISSIAKLDQLLQEPSTAPDCLILTSPDLNQLLRDRALSSFLVPLLILGDEPPTHPASIQLNPKFLADLPQKIEEAIANFLQLSPHSLCDLKILTNLENIETTFPVALERSLSDKQNRLSAKLKERLGYLGVYSKRNPEQFLRHLSEPERRAYLNQLKEVYQSIILKYFKENSNSENLSLNNEIDHLANLAFIADVSASQMLEIHMELMDDYAKQLKLEGRNLDILLDYRITLIDVIAHLCEMYRRSVFRGNKA
jgi:circadian clock protein KaiA